MKLIDRLKSIHASNRSKLRHGLRKLSTLKINKLSNLKFNKLTSATIDKATGALNKINTTQAIKTINRPASWSLASLALLALAFQNCSPMSPAVESTSTSALSTNRLPSNIVGGIGTGGGSYNGSSSGGVIIPGQAPGGGGMYIPGTSGGASSGPSGSAPAPAGGTVVVPPSPSGVVPPPSPSAPNGSPVLVPTTSGPVQAPSAGQALAIYFQPRDAAIEAGDTLYLGVSAFTGVSDRITYQWFKNGAAIAGATGSMLEIRNTNESNTGQYHVVISDGKTTIQSQTSNVRVRPARNPCLAGWYGQILRVTPGHLLVHESNFASVPAQYVYRVIQLPENYDGTIVDVPGCFNALGVNSGSTLFQCRNGQYHAVKAICVYEGGNG